MISANELRIGNWLKVIKPNEGFQKVNPKTIFNILYANDDAEYKPIPLTPEILIAAGFEKYEKLLTYKFSSFGGYLQAGPYEVNWYVEYVAGDKSLSKMCHYVHELQNLYFALTGTELKINL